MHKEISSDLKTLTLRLNNSLKNKLLQFAFASISNFL